MDPYAKIGRLLSKPTAPDSILIGEVIAIDGLTCTVKVADYTYSEVRLRVTDDPQADYLLVTPKLNSEVVICDLSGAKSDFLVIGFDQIGRIEYKKGTTTVVIDDKIKVATPSTTAEIGEAVKVKALLTEFEVDSTGIKIANAAISLKSLIFNIQTHLSTVCGIAGNAAGVTQMATDLALLQTLLK